MAASIFRPDHGCINLSPRPWLRQFFAQTIAALNPFSPNVTVKVFEFLQVFEGFLTMRTVKGNFN
jgi:hypothetical protein